MYSNWFLGYQFGVFNAGMHNSRTQGWNTAWYWGAEMMGAVAIGRFLDDKSWGSVQTHKCKPQRQHPPLFTVTGAR